MNSAQLQSYLIWLNGGPPPGSLGDAFLGLGTVVASLSQLDWIGTVAALRALTPPVLAIPVMLVGYNAVGDMSPKVYIYNPTDSRTDDGGSVIKPTAIVTLGRWNLVQ